jgi:hypothetical protein
MRYAAKCRRSVPGASPRDLAAPARVRGCRPNEFPTPVRSAQEESP